MTTIESRKWTNALCICTQMVKSAMWFQFQWNESQRRHNQKEKRGVSRWVVPCYFKYFIKCAKKLRMAIYELVKISVLWNFHWICPFLVENSTSDNQSLNFTSDFKNFNDSKIKNQWKFENFETKTVYWPVKNWFINLLSNTHEISRTWILCVFCELSTNWFLHELISSDQISWRFKTMLSHLQGSKHLCYQSEIPFYLFFFRKFQNFCD